MNVNSSLSHKKQEPEKKVLYIVGTPIGNLYDISSRAIKILKGVSLIACEDTRRTKKLMAKYEISNQVISFNKENSFKKSPQLIRDIKEGKSIALVSDAGMPGICDPGEELVREARINSIKIICIPGPCAATTALVTSGMSSSRFIFEGFLPKKKIERERILLQISKREITTIIFESPHRLKKLLKELKEYCGGEKEIHISRELTKIYEENINNSIDEVMNEFENKEILGEITIVIKGVAKKETSKINKIYLKEELHELVKAGLSLTAASKYIAKKNNIAKRIIYNLY